MLEKWGSIFHICFCSIKTSGRKDSRYQRRLKQLDILMKKNFYKNLAPFTNINSKWNIYLNVKCKIIKLLEENIRENLHDLGFGDKILYTASRV